MSRRTIILRSTIALAAACALAACATDPEPEADPGPEAVSVLAPQVSVLAPQSDTEIGKLIDGAPELVVAGEWLNVESLRRFYARHGFEPVWTTRQAQAASLVDAVLRAGDQGLDPELFHASLLRHRAAFPPLEQELLLSDAFLSYAHALAFGAVPVERRRDDETLTPKPIDVAGVLDVAIGSPDPAAVIEALAPTTPTYRALLQALSRYRSGKQTDDKEATDRSYPALRQVLWRYRSGTPADHKEATNRSHRAPRQALRRHRSATPAGDKEATDRLRTIEVNLERQRWLPRKLPADRVWVNVAEEKLEFYRANQPVFSTRVVVGQDVVRNQSPEFSAMIDASLFNPPWVIPSDIVANEILPEIAKDPDYLMRNHMVMLPNGEAEQLPGPDAGLGLIMFDMPNRFEVYLHDTPDRDIFNLADRRISHGCIRVQNPRELGALLMQEPIDTINQGIAMGSTTRHELPTPVPVFVVYETASVDADGRLQFYPDFYNRDAEIWRKLQRRPPARDHVAQTDNRPTSPKPF